MIVDVTMTVVKEDDGTRISVVKQGGDGIRKGGRNCVGKERTAPFFGGVHFGHGAR